MRVVSCRAIDPFLRAFDRKRIPREQIAIGTPYSLEHLEDASERIDWDAFRTLMRNVGKVFSDEEIIAIGSEGLKSPWVRGVMIVGRTVLSATGFYRWLVSTGGPGNQMFSNVIPRYQEHGPERISVELRLAPGDEPCREFFLFCQGGFQGLPLALGLRSAEVVAVPLPNGVRFDVHLPAERDFRARIRRIITRRVDAGAAAAELDQAMRELQRRYAELEAAQGQLAEYQRGLERLVEERTAELREARDQLAGTVEQLREAQGARERFFANISHEIRTPLALIMLATGDIETRAGHHLDERARANLTAVTDSARKLVRLVDELLLLAAGEETKLALNPEPTDVSRLVTTLGAAWIPAAETAGLVLDARITADITALVDPVAFERIATNLVSNAVKYTPAGGKVEIELAEEAQTLRLSVLDTGPGIADELRPRLFGRFERGASGRTGSGIGLSLVKQLVEAHGGTVEAIARPSGGTELRIMLSRRRLVVAAAAAVAQQPRLRPGDYGVAPPASIGSGSVLLPPTTARGTILIAEDDARLAELLARLLADDYKVVVALDGRTALELVNRHQPQLLITDVEMPGLDGIELARRFRHVTGDRLAPIIILSAIADLRTRLSGLEAGAVDYVLKPFDPRELAARVRSQFAMRDLALRLRRAEQLSAMGTLAAGLAHELRNPANGLVNAIGPLRDRLPAELTRPDTPTGQLVEVIAECAGQVAFLSSQLLGFQSGMALESRSVALDDVVARALILARSALDGVTVRTDLDGVGSVVCSPPLFAHVIANLVENAAYAAGPGGWVEVSSHAGHGTVTVEVADSGPGVPPELRERVFEPFYTTKPPGIGTGLGLPLARDIILRHGGVLEIRERGGHMIFAIDLPDAQVGPGV